MESEIEMSMQERELIDEDVVEEFLPLPQAATRYVWDDAYDTPIHYLNECCRTYFLEGGDKCNCESMRAGSIPVFHNYTLQVLVCESDDPYPYWTDLLRRGDVWGYQVVTTAPYSNLDYTFHAVE